MHLMVYKWPCTIKRIKNIVFTQVVFCLTVKNVLIAKKSAKIFDRIS